MSKVDIFAELHYYSEGLETFPVCASSGRPDWAPRPDFVGFRNDFSLDEKEFAVEWRRISWEGNRLTWLAVYTRAVDAVFGDRANHAGIGVWMRDAIPTETAPILQSMKGLCLHVSNAPQPADNVELVGHIRNFIEDYIVEQKRIVRLPALPPELSGLHFSASEVPVSRSYIAAGADEAFRLIANHIDANSIVNAVGPDVNRTIYKIGQPGRNGADLIKLDADSLNIGLLLQAIPQSFGNLSAKCSRLDSQTQSAEASATRLRLELDQKGNEQRSAAEENRQLREQVALLDKGVSPHLLELFAKIQREVRSLSGQLAGMESDVVRRLGRLESANNSANSEPRGYPPPIVERKPITNNRSGSAPKESMVSIRDILFYAFLVIVVFAAAAAVYFGLKYLVLQRL